MSSKSQLMSLSSDLRDLSSCFINNFKTFPKIIFASKDVSYIKSVVFFVSAFFEIGRCAPSLRTSYAGGITIRCTASCTVADQVAPLPELAAQLAA
jgi:hypothetical protein